jgi:hypothetical protein
MDNQGFGIYTKKSGTLLRGQLFRMMLEHYKNTLMIKVLAIWCFRSSCLTALQNVAHTHRHIHLCVGTLSSLLSEIS